MNPKGSLNMSSRPLIQPSDLQLVSKNKIEAENVKVAEILDKALDEKSLTASESLKLINLTEKEDLLALFSAANQIKKKNFGNGIFVYGFVYFSTYCRNNCIFCFYRRSNTKCPRYRKDIGETLEVAKKLGQSGVHLIDLTMGEDPLIHEGKNFDILYKFVKLLKDNVNVKIMISPGVVSRDVLRRLAENGADWYALYQETHNRSLFSKLRLNQSYEKRMTAKKEAKNEGLLVEDGILLGVGESYEDRVNSIFEMRKLKAHQVRAMGFVPQPGTPMENTVPPNILDEMKTIAVMRLLNADRLIPASLDIDGVKGLEFRLAAGANVVTSLIPPKAGLAGVAQASLGVNEGTRSVNGIMPFLESLNLHVALSKTYDQWVEIERESLKRRPI